MVILKKLDSFQTEPVTYIESQNVKEGVSCNIYSFVNDSSKDLGIITVSKGFSTPKQKVLKGDKTLEIFMHGNGKLVITNALCVDTVYSFPNDEKIQQVEVVIGETMQWQAGIDSGLLFAEVCWPPFTPDRFENIL